MAVPHCTGAPAPNFSPATLVLPSANLQESTGVTRRSLDEGETQMSDQTDVLQGTLDLLILRTIALQPMHGWAIAQRIQQISDELLRVQQGSLYPALHRLEHQGWIAAEWGASENNRRARFYSLTRAGRKQLETEVAKWERLSAGVNLVLRRS